jgi:hypothetical protein
LDRSDIGNRQASEQPVAADGATVPPLNRGVWAMHAVMQEETTGCAVRGSADGIRSASMRTGV